MKMEHRLSKRKPITVDVSIYYPPLGLIKGKSRDISLAGMFVETPGTVLPKSATLDIAFVIHNQTAPKLQRVRALVARVTGEGAGLMFDNFKHTSYSELQNLLNAA
jgi:hypothetical protein